MPGVATVLLMAACASSPPRHSVPEAALSGAASPEASYDWHGLLFMPFGGLLKDSPMPLHEVLLFHDESHPTLEPEGKDCYASERSPPPFLGQSPDPYLLCFEHDRLTRIEAVVRLPATVAAASFARACVLWLKNVVPPGIGNVCEGRDGSVAFSAHLVLLPDASAATVALTLTPFLLRESPP